MGLIYMRRLICTSKSEEEKISKKHAGTTAVRLRIPFQARIRLSCTLHMGLSCLFAFVRTPGLSDVIEKSWVFLPKCAGLFSHPKSQENKNSKKHASTTAVCLCIPSQARIRYSYTLHTGLSCLFAFVRTPGLSDVVEKAWVLPTCAGLYSHPKSQGKTSLKNTQAPRPFACASRVMQEYACHVHCTRGYHVCLRLFERPGSPTSLKKHGS